jgi:hypothetical protein
MKKKLYAGEPPPPVENLGWFPCLNISPNQDFLKIRLNRQVGTVIHRAVYKILSKYRDFTGKIKKRIGDNSARCWHSRVAYVADSME